MFGMYIINEINAKVNTPYWLDNIYRENLLKCNFPFPHVFSLSPFPLCALLGGTHGDRGAGDNTRSSDR